MRPNEERQPASNTNGTDKRSVPDLSRVILALGEGWEGFLGEHRKRHFLTTNFSTKLLFLATLADYILNSNERQGSSEKGSESSISKIAYIMHKLCIHYYKLFGLKNAK